MLLAPVVEQRKGDTTKLLAELSGPRLMCERASMAESRSWTHRPPWTADRKHTIEVVVDRFKVRPESALAACRIVGDRAGLAGGIARISAMDEARPERTFSANFACPVCGYSLPELEPRLFSFNNPAGACETCDGLGVEQFFDPATVVAHPELALAGGAVRGWDRRNAYYFQMLAALGEHYGFDSETPWQQLPRPSSRLMLYGSGGGDQVQLLRRARRRGQEAPQFEGVIPNMERRYRETESARCARNWHVISRRKPAPTVPVPA